MPKLLFEEAEKNKTKSWLLLSLFIIIVALLGWTIGYIIEYPLVGYIVAFVAVFYSLFSFYAGDKMILSMSGAKLASRPNNTYLLNTVEGLTIAAGLSTPPNCYVIDDTALNAFATGRDPEHSSIVVTKGLLDKLTREELEGVIAHEMSHVKNYDIRFMMLAAILVGVITLLSDFMLRNFLWHKKSNSKSSSKGGGITAILVVASLLLAALSPLIGKLIQLAVSRQREYLADSSAAILTRYPKGLMNALVKISKDPDPLVDNANRATAHLFISTPFREQKGFLTSLFSTHPAIEDRIKRLSEMA